MKANQQKFIVVVQGLKLSLLGTLDTIKNEYPKYSNVKLLFITSDESQLTQLNSNSKIEVRLTDYSNKSLAKIFSEEMRSQIAGVVCRGDKYVQFLRILLPYMPNNVLVASDKSLEITTNKRLMRQAFKATYPEITPEYKKVNESDLYERKEYWQEFSFPVIVKPASLASSILIQKCETVAELASTLKQSFNIIQEIYNKEGRTESPEIIVEEFLIGDFYSVDSYVLKKGETFHLPPVGYLPAEKIGINDFFLYKRWLPTDLSEKQIKDCFTAADKALKATELEYSSAHIEMILVDSEWKIIEIGPRIGRFRNIMYREAHGIDHGLNDLLVRLGIEPQVKILKNRYVSAYSIYPHYEGVLREITNIQSIENRLNINYQQQNGFVDDIVKQAKDGGHSLYETIFSNDTAKEHGSAVRWFEKSVKAVVIEGKVSKN